MKYSTRQLAVDPMSVIDHAYRLYDAGLSIMPVPYKCKSHGEIPGAPNFKWGMLVHTRHARNYISRLYQGLTNLAVVLDGYVYVVDCDTEEATKAMFAALKERGIVPFGEYTSNGGAHFYFESPVGPIPNLKFKGGDIKGLNSYVIAAGSVHPSGVPYVPFLYCNDHIPELLVDWLVDDRNQPLVLKYSTSRRGRPFEAYMTRKQPIPEGGRNDALYGAARSAHRNALLTPAIERDLLHIAVNRDGLPAKEAENTIRSAANGTPLSKRAERVKKLMAFTNQYAWQGRTGTSDKRVFIALIERYRNTPKGEQFSASLRHICEIARIKSTRTVRKALQRLVKQDLIEQMSRGSNIDMQASIWRFTTFVIESLPDYCGESDTYNAFIGRSPIGAFSQVNDFEPADLAEPVALGYLGATVYEALGSSPNPLTIMDISRLSGLSEGQVRQQLRTDSKLRQMGAIRDLGGRPKRYEAVIFGEQTGSIPIAILQATKNRKRQKAQHAGERAYSVGARLIQWRETYDPGFPRDDPE